MKKNLKIYQYLSLVRYKGVFKFLKNFDNKVSIILDLEDSSKDIFNNTNTIKLKKICREGLIFLSKKNDYNSINLDLYVRINSAKTKYFIDDIKCLKKVLKKNFIKGIFLPKVSDYKVVKEINELLKLKKKNIGIIPMIENQKGLSNLEKILLDDAQYKLISGIHYGHFDYCLSEKLWPFPEPYHKEYWNICNKIIKLCELYKKQFIQTPFPLINNPNLFYQCVDYICSKYKKLNFGMSLVNYNEEYFKIKKPYKSLRIKSQGKNKKFKVLFAKKIFDNYKEGKNNKKSFSLTNKWFIPPHQYIVAKYYLYKNEKK
jgi:citrate lyase beta subunit